jgi:hypothetical protein
VDREERKKEAKKHHGNNSRKASEEVEPVLKKKSTLHPEDVYDPVPAKKASPVIKKKTIEFNIKPEDNISQFLK